jgi:Fe-S-cluster containining protein
MIISKDSPKEEILALGKSCKRCGNCCNYESGFLAEDDLEKISSYLNLSPEETKNKYLSEVERFGKTLLRPKTIKEVKPFGKCIFLKENICSIHEVKPLMCRIGSCIDEGPELMEWFLLNYVVDPFDQKSIREWDARIKSHPTIKGGSTEELISDPDMRNKMLLDNHLNSTNSP